MNVFFAMVYPMIKKLHFRMFFATSVALALPHIAAAASAARVDAPPPAYADMEAAASAAAPGAFPTARTLRLTLSLDASPTAGAQAALGDGAAGPPDPETTPAVIGFDQGLWFIRAGGLRLRFTAPAAAPGFEGRRTLTVRVRLRPQGEGLEPCGAEIFEEREGAGRSEVSFAGLDAGDLMRWLDPGAWTALRVTSRGGAGGVSAAAALEADGTTIIFR